MSIANTDQAQSAFVRSHRTGPDVESNAIVGDRALERSRADPPTTLVSEVRQLLLELISGRSCRLAIRQTRRVTHRHDIVHRRNPPTLNLASEPKKMLPRQRLDRAPQPYACLTNPPIISVTADVLWW
jgi:hypothetical protein